MKRNPLSLAAAAVAVMALSLGGCATTTDVDKKIAEAQAKTDKKIESVETQVEDLQVNQKTTAGKVDDQGKRKPASSRRARSCSSSRSPRTACGSRSARSS